MRSHNRSRGRETLVVVSNRLPYNLPKGDGGLPRRNVGGLVNAVEPVLIARGGSWIGWDGVSLPSATAVSAAAPRTHRTTEGIDLHGVPLSEREIARYYHGFSNRALWPLFHDRLPTSVFQQDDYAIYERVNRRFAESALALAGPGDRLWIHDYHLLLVPGFLREMGFGGRIDFFLHIPFPPLELFRALPWRQRLLTAMLGADAVGFHTRSYRDNFVRAAESLAGARPRFMAGGDEFVLDHRHGRTVAGAAPIGIDVESFERIAQLPAVAKRVEKIQAVHGGRKIVFGADRLDYTKGIKERFLVVERYLASHPESAGRFVLLQIVVPSRHQVEEYRTLKREIDREAGRINAQYGREDWLPIVYLYRALDREELVAHYKAATVALVTPLRDGMNLVAAEFAASRVDGDGVLVVSEMAGIAERLHGAVPVNPYDLEGCAAALHDVLHMDEAERRERMTRMRERVVANPVATWAERCLAMGVPAAGPARVAETARVQPAARESRVET
jgi:trehalose 6-phosphate synthase/phosphatase